MIGLIACPPPIHDDVVDASATTAIIYGRAANDEASAALVLLYEFSSRAPGATPFIVEIRCSATVEATYYHATADHSVIGL